MLHHLRNLFTRAKPVDDDSEKSAQVHKPKSRRKTRRRHSHYQSFPGDSGSSKSLDKLKQLNLPPLKGKAFLDVGCNEGFFCGFAKFQGARRVLGLDNREKFVLAARERFPDCEFLFQSWDNLPDEKFDVILLASALHYADDQAALIHRLMEHLTPDGTLVLELGVVTDREEEWVEVERGIDTRRFPSWAGLKRILDGYPWSNIGTSVRQSGDPIPRYVVHVQNKHKSAGELPAPFGEGSVSRAQAEACATAYHQFLSVQLKS